MRVLRINPFPPEYLGGSQLYCKNISIYLAKWKGVKTDILTSDLLNRNKKIDYIGDSTRLVYKKCFSYMWGKNPLVNISQFLRKHYKDYDIIHAHGYYFFTTLQTAFLKRIKKFPYILHIHGGIQTSSKLMPATDSITENLQILFKEKIFDGTIGRFSLKTADKIISVASKDLSIIRQKYNISDENSYHIPNGVDINKFKRNYNIKREYITLLATRLSHIKGVDIFINLINELYKKDKSVKFLIIGDGYLKNLVLDAKKKLPIKFYTSYPYEKIQEIYNISKVILITSRFEGVPNVIYESLACETPVIASDVGGISSVIIPNKNGYLFDTIKYKNIVNLILDLVNDDNKIEKLGRNGRKLIEKEYSWEIVTKKVYNVYTKLLTDKFDN